MLFEKNRLVWAIAATSVLVACGDQSAPTSMSVESVAVDTAAEDSASARAALVDRWLAGLSLDQKVLLLSGKGYFMNGAPPEIDKVPGAAGYTQNVDELGIPSIVLADGPAGLRIKPRREGDEATYYATAFPVATTLASTWDSGLLEQVGQAMGDEIREYGVDVFLAPGMNLHRNPLTGRNFEYYSEDPLVSGLSAAAVVNGVESTGVGATIKHYVANNQETNRFLVDTQVNERALRELYLRGFEIAIRESQPWAVMSSYNNVNGTAVSEEGALLTDVLRNEFNFEGVVMTDWWGGQDPVAQIKAGNDLLMPGDNERTAKLYAAVAAGELSEDTINISVKRILNTVAMSPANNGYAFSNQPDLSAHAEVARRAAADGTVLLKNDGQVLPITADATRVAAYGVTSYDFISGGTGSGDVNEAYVVSLVEGMQGAGLTVDDRLAEVYRTYIAEQEALLTPPENPFLLPDRIAEMPVDAVLSEAVAASDVALITIGRNSGEFADREVAGDFDLTDAERQMLSAVSQAYRAAGKPVIVVLNIGNVIETASWRGLADAIVLPWQGGQEAGNGVVDVLTGKVNPSGRLATTFPIQYADVPSADPILFPGVQTSDQWYEGIGGFQSGFPSKVEYQDGVFVGYRYFDSFDVDVAYPFGFGMSYTDFSARSVQPVSLANGVYSMTVEVTNTGEVAGKQVIQAYVSAPSGQLNKPRKELRAYAKTGLLDAGASQTLTLSFNERDLASFDETARAWVADAGTYTVHVAYSVSDVAFSETFERAEPSRFQPATVDLRRSEPIAERY